MDLMTSSSAQSGGSYVTVTKEQVRRVAQQLPPHDSDARHCHGPLSDDEKRRLEQFRDTRYRDALGQGELHQLQKKTVCRQCGELMFAGDLAVSTQRAVDDPAAAWHVQCFVCSKCHEALVNLVHFWTAGHLYCGRHHAETVRPRCFACDEIIFADKCTQADGQFWHVEHYVCSQCSLPLGGRRYVIRDGRPSCVACFNALLADFCDTCGHAVSASQRHVTMDGRTWHATPTCFRCARCHRPLLGKSLVAGAGTLFCSAECSRERKHVAADVTRPDRGKRSRSLAGKNRRKSLGDLDSRERKTSKISVNNRSLSVYRLRETSI